VMDDGDPPQAGVGLEQSSAVLRRAAHRR